MLSSDLSCPSPGWLQANCSLPRQERDPALTASQRGPAARCFPPLLACISLQSPPGSPAVTVTMHLWVQTAPLAQRVPFQGEGPWLPLSLLKFLAPLSHGLQFAPQILPLLVSLLVLSVFQYPDSTLPVALSLLLNTSPSGPLFFPFCLPRGSFTGH